MASIGDAHTVFNFWNGYDFPLQFYMFGTDIYVVNAEKGMEHLLYQKVTAVNGMPIADVLDRLTTIIPHENEGYLKNALAKYLAGPAYLYGLGIISDKEQATFTFEIDGNPQEITLSARDAYETPIDFSISAEDDVVLGKFSSNYNYTYLPDANYAKARMSSARSTSACLRRLQKKA